LVDRPVRFRRSDTQLSRLSPRRGAGGHTVSGVDGDGGDERGQAAVEWVAALLVVVLALGAALALAPPPDGRSFGGFLAHRLVCAVKRGCDDGDAALAAAYGERDAKLVRRHAPNLVYEPGESELPVDWRRCRARRCDDASDDRDLDVHRSHTGEPATVFTRVLRRRGRLYLQYWLYYAESNTTWAGSDAVWAKSWLLPQVRKLVSGTSAYPGFHEDDWESVQLRIDPDGQVWSRASSHGHYQGCKQPACRNRWVPGSGWSRVSRGSHAGHIPTEGPWPRRPYGRPRYPGLDLRERTTTAEGLRLIPLETIDRDAYAPRDDDVRPPWRKPAYRDPESGKS
jgi:hypothetical protein